MSTVTASNKDLSSTLSDMFSSKPSISPSSNTYEPGAALNSSSSTDTSTFSSMTWQTWLIIILVLALLGFNIFIYLAKGTGAVAEFINKYFGPLLKLLGISVLETTKQTINTSATGTKAGVDVVANTTTGAINAVENVSNVNNGARAPSSQKNSMPVQQQDELNQSQDKLDSTLNGATRSSEPRPDDSASTYGKAGWCYIGEDNNTRTCAEVGVNDRCMSGNIFPSQDICMNPNLRA
jgi:hypothetical protein